MSEFAAGRYRVKPCGQEVVTNKQGNLQLELRIFPIGKYDIDRPEAGPIECSHDQRTIFFPMTAKNAAFVLEDMRAIGLPEDASLSELHQEHPMQFKLSEEFDALCAHEDYEGKQQERWKISRQRAARPAGDLQAMKNLDTLLGLSGRKQKASAKAAKVPADGIPF
jgi:hypothetical protein